LQEAKDREVRKVQAMREEAAARRRGPTMTAPNEVIMCGFPIPPGPCQRKGRAGIELRLPPGGPAQNPAGRPAPPGEAMRIRRPITWHDELGDRCVRCAGWCDLPISPNEVRPGSPPNTTNGPRPSDRSRNPVPDQLRLDVDNRPPQAAQTQEVT
jgi:hypothetical protein